ncbi:hypothetical protein [Asaia krungthepensis]|uniref:DUF3995 domain-containing protein n=1 Tax=Asaia krungthepensis NRIC 0535 TaxID=1307925 RepID=A0ABQ0PVB6_9PROT|nr:hypothetical protein [Asaia krungthepensis]GBQ82535.1 hypothetical protein AA0535_0010 [Asaia krungthepensis NRIC 0535]
MIYRYAPFVSKGLLTLSGLLLAIAAAAHAATLYYGPSAYGFMGAGPDMVRKSLQGDWHPAAIIGGIGLVLLAGAYCALAGARLLPRLPLPALRLFLFTVTALLLGRGAIGIFLLTLLRLNGVHMETLYIAGLGGSFSFWIWSSTLCLLLGGLQLAATSLSRDLY